VAASLTAVERAAASTERRDGRFRNAELSRRRMSEEGFELLDGEHAIVPVMFGDAALAARIADAMLDHGVYVTAFSFPVVPREQARIRVQLSAAHTDADIDEAGRALVRARTAARDWAVSLLYSSWVAERPAPHQGDHTVVAARRAGNYRQDPRVPQATGYRDGYVTGGPLCRPGRGGPAQPQEVPMARIGIQLM